MTFQVGIHIAPKLLQKDDYEWFPSALKIMFQQTRDLDEELADPQDLTSTSPKTHIVNQVSFEEHKKAQAQRREQIQKWDQETKDSFADFFEARKEAQSWARGFPGAEQARAQHDQRMGEIEARKQKRAEARMERHALAAATQSGFASYFEARKKAQAQRREQKQKWDQEFKNSFADFFEARKEAQSWARGFPGAEQAADMHEQQMEEIHARKRQRAEGRSANHALAAATQSGFARYFEARKEAQKKRREKRQMWAQETQDGFAKFFHDRKEAQLWARGFRGADQAWAEHEQRMEEMETRKQARFRARMEKRSLAAMTRDGFANYFEARKVTQKQRREKKRMWAQETKDAFSEFFEARKVRQSWARGLAGAKQAESEHKQRMKDIENRKQVRTEARRFR